MNHPDFAPKGHMHYYHTPKEMDSLTGKGSGTHDHDAALCGNGSFHFARTKDLKKVTCPVCFEKLKAMGKINASIKI